MQYRALKNINLTPETQQAIDYLRQNRPTDDVIERFHGCLKGGGCYLPVYDPVSDTVSAVTPLMFTLAIAHDIGEGPYGVFSERFCFEDQPKAIIELARWHQRGLNSEQRPIGWVATRNELSSRRLRDSFEKYYSPTYGQELLKYSLNSDGIHRHYCIQDNAELIQKDLGYDPNTIKHLAAYLLATRQVL